MKVKVGREWRDLGPGHVQSTLLSSVLPSRHTQQQPGWEDEASLFGATFPEKGKRPFAAGNNRDDIGTHEIAS